MSSVEDVADQKEVDYKASDTEGEISILCLSGTRVSWAVRSLSKVRLVLKGCWMWAFDGGGDVS